MTSSTKAIGIQVAAAALLGMGAFLLVTVWLHVINPDLAKYEEQHSANYYVAGSAAAFLILLAAWCLNLYRLRTISE